MARHAGTGHAVGMADGDGATGDVESVVVDTEGITAVQHLAGEGFVELPDIDIVHPEPVNPEQLGHGEYRADAHLVRFATRHHEAPQGTEGLKARPLGGA